jgi:nitroimidazol reductase NimA-like FMN-containing flavoprotein (pyridoxamine 5'-phosphate oxidase superfamily)
MANPEQYPHSAASTVKRQPARAAYDVESVHAVLDAAPVGHAGFVADGRAVVIPMLFGRDADRLYLHGSVASRFVRAGAPGLDLCLTVTLVDGLVLARSAFHHSMNYRSAVVFGRAEAVEGDEAVHGLRVISEHLLAGRWDEVRAPSPVELRQTAVLRMTIEEASAKVRTGGPIDEPDDLALPVWAGVLPSALTWGEPVPEPDLPAGVAASAVVRGTPLARAGRAAPAAG